MQPSATEKGLYMTILRDCHLVFRRQRHRPYVAQVAQMQHALAQVDWPVRMNDNYRLLEHSCSSR
eukprot:scaffold93433_cov32-Tisochrysis_lutea.AAC.2